MSSLSAVPRPPPLRLRQCHLSPDAADSVRTPPAIQHSDRHVAGLQEVHQEVIGSTDPVGAFSARLREANSPGTIAASSPNSHRIIQIANIRPIGSCGNPSRNPVRSWNCAGVSAHRERYKRAARTARTGTELNGRAMNLDGSRNRLVLEYGNSVFGITNGGSRRTERYRNSRDGEFTLARGYLLSVAKPTESECALLVPDVFTAISVIVYRRIESIRRMKR